MFLNTPKSLNFRDLQWAFSRVGRVFPSMLRHQFCARHGPRQPPRFCSSTRWAASAKVGNALDAPFLGEGIAARAGQHPVGEVLLAGLGVRDECGGAEPEFASPAADDEPLDPASGPGRLDEQVTARPV